MQDPTIEQMRKHLDLAFSGLLDPHETDANVFDREESIYWFAADYHGGQCSNLYEALCASEYRPGPTTNGPEPESTSADMYKELEATFAPRPVYDPDHEKKGTPPIIRGK